MQTVRDVPTLKAAIAELRHDGGTVALVPTMGALHAGHMALVAEGRRRADHVVASVFVNPTQFAPNEDLSTYPSREDADAAMLDEAGCALLWAPDVAAMYPLGFVTRVSVSGVSERWDGAARPGHFAGVATVVLKLLNQVRPDVALFGEKDYQQLAVIRRLVADLDLGVEVIGVPTIRDADGLALSSRNAYLSADERIAARTLPRVLGEATVAIAAGEPVVAVLAAAAERLVQAGFGPIDYLALVDAVTLEPLAGVDRAARIIAAGRLGTTRLIDNLPVVPRRS